jgi:hypothetical protein
MWCIPKLDDEYTERMLDVLEVYEREYEPKRPVICLDEKSFQLLSTPRGTQPVSKGKFRREDYEYKRHGTVNAFVAIEPKGNFRHVRVTTQRRGVDFAAFLRFLVLEKYAEADKVVLVSDNLNIHTPKILHEALGEEAATKLLARLEWHYTPKHASWLNMAEIEIGVLTKQCLARKFSTKAEATKHVRAWQRRRNLASAGINWTFTRVQAREKFRLA